MLVQGDGGNNSLVGSAGNDTITGSAGDDTINGIAGNDYLLGQQGNDIITDGDGSSTVAGGMGNDRITIGNGSDLIYGDEGADTITAGNGNDTIVGGTGNGAIDSLDGADFIIVGSGADLILGNGGDDTIASGAGNDSAVGGFGNDLILGQQGDDILLGNQGDDTLVGGMGNDTLYGGQGNDLLYGNEGNDLIIGGEGDDTAVFSGTRASYTITTDAQGDFILAGSTGTATVSSTEHFRFDDGTVDAANLIQGTSTGGGGTGPSTTPVPGAGQVFLEANGQVLGTFTTIQAAVNAAAQTGNQIVVGAGTYQEQVTDNGKTLSITGQGVGKTIISSPDSANLQRNVPGDDKSLNTTSGFITAVVGATNNANLTLSGLTIDGRGQGATSAANGDAFVGVGAVNAVVSTTGTGGTTGVDITGASAGNAPNGEVAGGGRNSGIIIDNTDGTNRTDNLTGLTIENFQKNGISAVGNNLTVNSSFNKITGSGDVDTIAQNGLEFVYGANGSSRNDTISGIEYIGDPNQANATDIEVYQAGPNVAVANDIIMGGPQYKKGGSFGVGFYGSSGGSVVNTAFSNLSVGIDSEPDPGQAGATQSNNSFNNVVTPTMNGIQVL